MNHGLSLRLARIVLDQTREVTRSKDLSTWLDEHAIGHTDNRRIHLTDPDRARIRDLLAARGIDPAALLTMGTAAHRSEAFWISTSEKAGAGSVGRDRSLVRTLPGRTLKLSDDLPLPTGASLDISNQILVRTCRHEAILLVENRECFDAMERVTFPHPALIEDPLVLFRGSPGISAGSASLIARSNLPVDVFGDIDPEGLAIAARVPRARSFVHPPLQLLEKVVARNPNHARFRDQIGGASGARDDHPAWLDDLWHFVLKHACALPQEAFIDI